MTEGAGLRRWPGLLMAIIFIACSAFVAWQFLAKSPVDTDILSLLPVDIRDPVVGDAIARANSAASDRVVLMIEGATADRRQAAADALSRALVATGMYRPATDEGRDLWSWLFALRAVLLCPADRALLAAGGGAAIAQDALRQWYGAFGVANSALLHSDPLLLTPRLVQCFAAAAMAQAPSPQAVILSGRITASAFRLDIQDTIAAVLDRWRSTWGTHGLKLSRAGAVFHAAYGAARARADMSFIGSVTMVAILALYLAMFRSLRPPVLAFVLVVGSLAAGLSATLLIFGRVHLMGLIFGSALTGMVVDYTTYFLITGIGAPDRSGAARRASMYRPLTLGMATSVGAFAALLAFPVPAFRQIATFGGVGLIAAWAGTVWLLPLIEGRRSSAGPAARLVERLATGCLAARPPRVLALLAVLGAVALLAGALSRGQTLDDIRQFQSPSAALAAEEGQILRATRFAPAGTFFLVRGASAAACAANEERLLDRLAAAGADRHVLLAASWLDPSPGRRASGQALIADRLIAPGLPGLVATLGGGNPQAYRGPDAHPALPAAAAALRGHSHGQFWSIVPLTGATPPVASSAGLADPAWQWVEPAARYSALLGHYRLLATAGLAAAVATTALVLLLVYRRLAALAILLPTVIALVATPSITGLLGLPYSFFSAMGLFLVIGAGVDYAIFQWEHPSEQGRWTRVGILLAATMTCLSTGLLGLSSVLPVLSFGITVALGILLSLVLSPLVRGLERVPAGGLSDG